MLRIRTSAAAALSMPPNVRKGFSMRRALSVLASLVVAAAFAVAPSAAQQKGKGQRILNVYNWSDYVDPAVLEEFTKSDRHQGPLRHLRHQRHARGQAPGRPFRLRRRGADRIFPPAADQGEDLPAARQVEAAEPRASVAGGLETPRPIRSRQRLCRELHVGHDRHRLQRRQGARTAGPRRQDRQLGHRLQAGESRASSRIAASTCWIPPTTSCRRRCAISASIPTRRARRTCRRPPIW